MHTDNVVLICTFAPQSIAHGEGRSCSQLKKVKSNTVKTEVDWLISQNGKHSSVSASYMRRLAVFISRSDWSFRTFDIFAISRHFKGAVSDSGERQSTVESHSQIIRQYLTIGGIRCVRSWRPGNETKQSTLFLQNHSHALTCTCGHAGCQNKEQRRSDYSRGSVSSFAATVY